MFAGVYNEYIIKKVGSDVDIMIQNVFMYIDSIVCNVFVLSIQKFVRQDAPENDFLSAENLKVTNVWGPADVAVENADIFKAPVGVTVVGMLKVVRRVELGSAEANGRRKLVSAKL